MADENILPRDQNHVATAGFESSSTPGLVLPGQIDEITGRILVDNSGGGSGTVTSVSVVTNQGVSGSVATATTTPAITLSLGALTGVTSINGLVITANTGAITTGSWSATAIPLSKGGTGADLSAVAKGGLISGTGAGTVGITAVGSDGQVLSADAASAGGVKWIAAGGTGTVTTLSVVTANGFAGTVANATTTPAITLTTSITGVLKGNGTAISAATAGSDYAVGSIGLAGGQTIAGSTLTTENLTLRANAADLTTGAVIVSSSKEASSSTVGSVQLAGGLAVAKRVFALDMTVTNTITGSISGNAGTATAVAVGGITGLGTGVATALAINVASAGAFITFNGDAGTPSALVGTNISGTAASLTAGNATVAATVASANEATDTTCFPLFITASGTQSLATKNNTSLTFNSNTGALGATSFVGAGTSLTGIPYSLTGTANQVTLSAATGNVTFSLPNDLRITSASVGTNADSIPTLSSTSTLTNKTLTSPTLTTPSAFTTGGTITLAENTALALDPAGSADGKYTGITITGITSYAQAFGELNYLAVANSKWTKTDADASATAGPVMLGMVVVAGGSDGAACTMLLLGQIRADAAFPALTVGAPVYVGETAGAIQVAIPTGADNVIRVVGFALTADEIYFNPSQDHQITVA